MKKWLLAIVLGSVLVLGACGGDNDATDNNATVEAGEAAFQKSCVQCHGGNLKGGAGPPLDKAGATHTAAEIEDIIENGKGRMAAQTSVSAEDRTEIANWLADKK